MDSKLDLSSLKDKIASKLNQKDDKGKRRREKKDKPTKETVEPKKESGKELSLLRKEALELGATEEDIEMIAGIPSGDESEEEFTATAVDKGFTSDLSKFMKDIGFDKVVVEDEKDEDVEEEEKNENGDEDSDEDEENEEDEEDSDEEDSDEDEEGEASNSDSDLPPKKDKGEADLSAPPQTSQKTNPSKAPNVYSVNSNKLIIQPRVDWYNTPFTVEENATKPDRFARERLLERAQKLVEAENKTYLEEFAANTSQKKFLGQILSDGTLNDKISALTLMVQEAPMHNIKAFDTLMGYCEKKSRTAALQAINAVKDMFVNGLLPDRRLVAFDKQKMSSAVSDAQLMVYYFEDHIKKAYFHLVEVLETLSHDPILHVRMSVVTHVFDLLRAKPEQEQNLLRLGVNKLGDVDNKVAAKTSYQVLQLEQAHPAMTQIVTEAVVDVVFKNTDHNTQYYGVTTLNQTILSRKDPEVANRLVRTYFALFEKVLVQMDEEKQESTNETGKSSKGRVDKRKGSKKGKKGGRSVKATKDEHEILAERNTKLFSALLTGLNRAFSFCTLPADVFEQHLDTLFRITHSTNFNTAVQALVLVHHIISSQGLDSGRYYRTLYESLLDPRLVSSSKQGIYLNLLFKSLKGDKANPSRVFAFVKRILQVCSHWMNVGAITGMLYLLMELAKIPEIKSLIKSERKEKKKNKKDEKEEDEKEEDEKEAEPLYDPRKRDPAYANADSSLLWEINQFLNHFHPTVAIYAQSLLDGTPQAKPDLGLYTLAHFLDRFVYKNPKQKATTKGSSIMQPLGGAHTGSLLVRATNIKDSEIPANTVDWLAKKASQVRPDEQFFHQYFTTKLDKRVVTKDAPQNDAERMEKEDEEVWNALVKSRPDVEGPSDDDLDDFDDFDMSDMDDEEEVDEEDEEEVVDEEDEDDGEEDDGEEGIFAINEEDEVDDDDEVSDEVGEEKRAREGEPEKKNKRQKLKNLPVFASADDYAAYLDSEDEDYS